MTPVTLWQLGSQHHTLLEFVRPRELTRVEDGHAWKDFLWSLCDGKLVVVSVSWLCCTAPMSVDSFLGMVM